MTDPFVTVEAQLERDRWGRPLIIPATGTDRTPRPYLRVTKLAGAPDDTYNLQVWGEGMAAQGVAIRPDIAASVVAARAAITSRPNDYSGKRALKDAVKEAKEAAGAGVAARAGTTLHSFTERVDLGEELGYVPLEYLRDVQAYQKIMADYGIKVVSVEQFTVCDELEVGGTPDRVLDVGDLEAPDGTKPGIVIGDLKSGKEVVKYGSHKISIQLGIYANSKIYKPSGERLDLPGNPSKKWGLVIHLPIHTGEASLVWMNIEEGYKAAVELARPILAWQKRSDLAHPVAKVVAPPVTGDVLAKDDVVLKIEAAKTLPELEQIYYTHMGVWTPAHTDAATAQKKLLAA